MSNGKKEKIDEDKMKKIVKEAVKEAMGEEKEKQETKEQINKSIQLAKISKRREELKEKLEGGQLKADEASSVGIEYEILKKNYEDLINDLKKEL